MLRRRSALAGQFSRLLHMAIASSHILMKKEIVTVVLSLCLKIKFSNLYIFAT